MSGGLPSVGDLLWYWFPPRRRLFTSLEKLSRRLRRYLEACATDRLTRIELRQEEHVRAVGVDGDLTAARAARDDAGDRDSLDEKLAKECACLLDQLAGGPSRRRRLRTRHGPDDEQTSLVRWGEWTERWALAALLFTERPHGLWRRRLPRLALLYRCYPLPTELARDTSKPSKVVSDFDLRLLISNCWTDDRDLANEIMAWAGRVEESLRGLRSTDVPGEDHRTGIPFSALDLYQLFGTLGVKARMDRREVEAMVEKMRNSGPNGVTPDAATL